MDFEIPAEIGRLLTDLDEFIAREIAPLEAEHPQYFDHRREFARTDVEHGGIPRREWEDLLEEMMGRADRAGLYRYCLARERTADRRGRPGRRPRRWRRGGAPARRGSGVRAAGLRRSRRQSACRR
ncbi:MAG: hypothetical protein E6G56_06955 [Actinobacteria bacterium]|nr:MAG: hypothetical protein E6G56_06955 [Actinomycetota bacterium]